MNLKNKKDQNKLAKVSNVFINQVLTMSKKNMIIGIVVNVLIVVCLIVYIQAIKKNYRTEISKDLDDKIGSHIRETFDEFKRKNYEIIIKEKLIKYYKLDEDKAAIFASIINASSKRFDVEWERIAAKIKVESNFNFYAKSKATRISSRERKQSAYGVLQIKPTTGDEIARELDEDWHGLHSLYNPVTNIYFGTYYYARLAIIFKDDFEKSEKAYNVGLTGFYRGYASERHWKKVLLEYKRLKDKEITDLENEINRELKLMEEKFEIAKK